MHRASKERGPILRPWQSCSNWLTKRFGTRQLSVMLRNLDKSCANLGRHQRQQEKTQVPQMVPIELR